MQPGEPGACRVAVLWPDMAGHEAERGRQHRGVIGEAQRRDEVGNRVNRQHEICQRGEQGGAHRMRGLAVECAVIGGEEILGERNERGVAAELLPETAAQAGLRG